MAKQSKYATPAILQKVWELYRKGETEVVIANSIGCNPSLITGIIAKARATCGVQSAMDAFGVIGDPVPNE